MKTEDETLECPNCKRVLNKKYLTRHHSIPRQKGGSHLEKITLCISCANHLHNLYPNSLLKRSRNAKIWRMDRQKRYSQNKAFK